VGTRGAGLTHLKEFFGDARAQDITTDRITAYVVTRQAERAANATINRELAALKRMFRLAEISGKVAQRPYVPMLREEPRGRTFEEIDDALNAPMRTVVAGSAFRRGFRRVSIGAQSPYGLAGISPDVFPKLSRPAEGDLAGRRACLAHRAAEVAALCAKSA